MAFYRYDYIYDGCGSLDLCLTKWYMYRETPSGYWVSAYVMAPRQDEKFLRKQKLLRWVSKTSRKRYCYPTEEAALTSFIARTQRRIAILKGQIESCEDALEKARAKQI